MTSSTPPIGGPFGCLTRRRALAGGAALTLLSASGLRAQTPGEGYNVIIAFPPGGTSTASMQPLADILKAKLGAPVMLVYKPGAGGDVAAVEAAKAPADGHTLFFGHAGPLAINPHLAFFMMIDPLKDFAPIAQVVSFPIVVCAHTKLGVTDIKSLVALGKTRQLVIGSSGNGSVQHLSGEAFKRAYGLEMLHLPFAGGGPLQEALEKGALDVLCETGSNVVRHIREARLRGLAVMAKQRLATLPDVPTFTELGEPELDIAAWFGLLVPAATPVAMQERLAKAVLEILAEENVKKALLDIGGLPTALGPVAFQNLIADEYNRWGKFIQEAGLKSTRNDGGLGLGTPR
jgi:tripartite-type tricarboxylate transporter receptor subunit TctC